MNHCTHIRIFIVELLIVANGWYIVHFGIYKMMLKCETANESIYKILILNHLNFVTERHILHPTESEY